MSGDCVQSISEKCLCGSLCAKNTNEARTPQPLGHYRGGRERNKILRLQVHTHKHIYKRVAFFFFLQGTNFMSLAEATCSKNTPNVTRYLMGLHQWKVWRFAETKTRSTLCRSVSVEEELEESLSPPKVSEHWSCFDTDRIAAALVTCCLADTQFDTFTFPSLNMNMFLLAFQRLNWRATAASTDQTVTASLTQILWQFSSHRPSDLITKATDVINLLQLKHSTFPLAALKHCTLCPTVLLVKGFCLLIGFA